MRQQFGYLHVPKTAGTSVTAAITAAVEAGRDGVRSPIFPFVMDRSLFGDFDDVDGIPPQHRVFSDDVAQVAEYDVVIGHFWLSTLLHGRDLGDVVALFREPRTRLLSLYTFWRSWPPDRHAEWGPYTASRRAAELAWPDFLEDRSLAAQIDNATARMLLHPHPLVPVGDFIAPEHHRDVQRDALAVLADLGHVDVIERGEACWTSLGDWLGTDLAVGRDNVTASNDASLDPNVHFTAAANRSLVARTGIDAAIWGAAARIADPGLSASDVDELATRTAAGQRERLSMHAAVAPVPASQVADGVDETSGISARIAGAGRRFARRLSSR